MPLPPRPFYLIRHGQSVANARCVAAGGGLDTPLTALGRAQARAAARVVRALELRPGAVVHSAMRRTRDTASPLAAALGLPTRAVRALREHHLGVWEGLPWDAIRPAWAAGLPPPGGESLAQLRDRVRGALARVLGAADGPPLIVAHGGTFQALGAVYGVPIGGIRNAVLHLFTPAPGGGAFPWRVWAFTGAAGVPCNF
jgi:broad specificity phosphatase PhoE